MPESRDTWSTPDFSDMERHRDAPPTDRFVLVSHAADDVELVKRIFLPVASRHFQDTHIANRNMAPVASELYRKRILVSLARCGRFAVALSPRCEDSQWVRFEVGWALANRPKDDIVVAILEDCDAFRVHQLLPEMKTVDCRSFSSPETIAASVARWWAGRRLERDLRPRKSRSGSYFR